MSEITVRVTSLGVRRLGPLILNPAHALPLRATDKQKGGSKCFNGVDRFTKYTRDTYPKSKLSFQAQHWSHNREALGPWHWAG